MFKNTLIAFSAMALVGITAPSFADNDNQGNFNSYQRNRDIHQDYREFQQNHQDFHRDARDARHDNQNNPYAYFMGRYDSKGRSCVHFDKNHVRQIRHSCLKDRHDQPVNYRYSNGGTYTRGLNGATYYHPAR